MDGYELHGHLSEQLFSAIVDCFANFSSSVGSVSEEIYSLQAVYFSYTFAAKAAPDNRLDCVLIDEAQFLSPAQVDQALATAVLGDIPVLAYGIRTDFQTRSFPGSQRLMEIAHALEEMKTICRCGKKAIFNSRLKDGAVVREGSQVMIDGDDAEYEARCARCYLEG